MNNEEHDDLWHLLGKAKEPAVSPFFSRNVVREIRELRQEKPGISGWLHRHWRVATFATCAVAIAIGALTERRHEEHQLLAMAESVSKSPDYQVIAHLDELLDSEESSIWLDGNTY